MTSPISAKNLKPFLGSIILLSGLFIHITAFAEAALIPLGSLWPGSPDGGGVALGLSDDGAIAVGWSTAKSIEDDVAFRWDETAGLETPAGINVSKAEVISGDGLTIFGVLDVTKFMWTESGGFKTTDLNSDTLVAASYDGSIQAGMTNGSLGEAFRRVGGETGTVSLIGSLTTNLNRLKSAGLAISNNGSVIVG